MIEDAGTGKITDGDDSRDRGSGITEKPETVVMTPDA